jgi:hypothetical protein
VTSSCYFRNLRGRFWKLNAHNLEVFQALTKFNTPLAGGKPSHQLANSMERGTAVSCWARLDTPRTFYGTKMFISVFTRAPPQVSIINQLNPVHTFQSLFFKGYFSNLCLGLPSDFPSGVSSA